MVLALIKKPFVWVWALLTAPIRWLRGGRRRHRRGLFSKVGDLMPTLSFMSFMRGGGEEAELPLQCERDQQPSEDAPPARVVEEEAPPPPKKKRVAWSKKAATTKLQARWRGRKARQNSRKKVIRRQQSFSEGTLGIHRDVHPLTREDILARRAIAHCRLRQKVGRLVTVAWPVLNFVKSCIRCYVGTCLRVLLFIFVQLPMLGRTRRDFKWPLLTAACNAFLTLFWPRLRIIVSNVLRDRVREIVNELLDGMPNPPIKSLVSLECNLGRRAITIEEAWLSTSYHSYDFLDLHLVCSLEGDTLELVSDLCVDSRNKLLPQLTAVVRGLSFQSERLKVKFGPLSTSLPCFGALQVAFAEAPKVDLRATVTALDAISLTGFSSFNVINGFVEGLVQNLLRNHFSWPRAVIVPTKGWAHNIGAVPRCDAEWWGDGIRLEKQRELVKGALSLSVFDCATAGPMSINGSTFYVRASVGSRIKEAPLVLNDRSTNAQCTFDFHIKPDVDDIKLEVYERSKKKDLGVSTTKDMLLGQAVLDHVQSIDSLPPHVKVRRVLKLEKQQTQLQSGLEYVEKKMGKVYRKVVKAEEEVIHEGKVCCGCAKDQRTHKTSKVAKKARKKAVGDERKLPEKSSFTRKHSFDSPRASSGLGFRATQLKVGLEWAPALTLRRHFHHRLMLGLVAVLVVAMGRWVYAEIHSRTWLADFCGLAVDVVASGALAAPFLVTAGMRLLHRAHDYAAGDVYADASAGKVIAAEDW
jgi:hypothetical protein